ICEQSSKGLMKILLKNLLLKKLTPIFFLPVDKCHETRSIPSCELSELICNHTISHFYNSGLSIYDIRITKDPIFDFSINYLVMPEVMTAIGAQKPFVSCSPDVEQRFVLQGDL